VRLLRVERHAGDLGALGKLRRPAQERARLRRRAAQSQRGREQRDANYR
jgi:hypothetical protein